jgi:spore coat polysaccharide biosynthesis protein SpsF
MAGPGIIVQARMGSTRLPGKVLEDLAGAPAMVRLFERLRRAKGLPKIVLATSTLAADDSIADLVATQPDVALWRGPEQDVLKRYADAAEHYDLDPIVRITADCPLMEPTCIDAVLDAHHKEPGYHYADNVVPRTFPHGYDVQVFSRHALQAADQLATLPADREHVGPYIIRNAEQFPAAHVIFSGNPVADLRITLDYPEDLILIRGIYERLYPIDPNFGLDEILALRKKEPALFQVNQTRAIYG